GADRSAAAGAGGAAAARGQRRRPRCRAFHAGRASRRVDGDLQRGDRWFRQRTSRALACSTRGTAMKILLITPLDYRTYDNIEHYMARFYRDQGDDLTVLSKLMNRNPSVWSMMRETVTCSGARRSIDGIEVVFVDPLFNYYAGLGRSIEANIGPGA